MGHEHQGRLFIPERKRIHPDRLLLKIGSDSTGTAELNHLAPQIADLMSDGFQVAILSSGSIMRGKMVRPDVSTGNEILIRQGLSGLGQPVLMQDWREALGQYGVSAAQELIEIGHINSPTCTYGPLWNWYLENGIVPVLNYNDARNSFETEQDMRFKDNDCTTSVVADIILPGTVGFLTRKDGVYRDYAMTDRINLIDIQYDPIDDVVNSIQNSNPTENGTGGILSKLNYGYRIAEEVGSWVAIANAKTVSLRGLLTRTEQATYIRPKI